MSANRKLLIATTNKGKIIELRTMIRSLNIEVVGLDDIAYVEEVAETGSTFSENAELKAVGYARQTRLPALADDSGLEVAALGGRPGVHSARYGGDVAFADKMRLLVEEIHANGSTDRRARFVSSIVLADADGRVIGATEGAVDGIIVDAPRGEGGFGYDPVFVPDGYTETFGELPAEVKSRMSHRSRAFSAMMPFLARFFGLLT